MKKKATFTELPRECFRPLQTKTKTALRGLEKFIRETT